MPRSYCAALAWIGLLQRGQTWFEQQRTCVFDGIAVVRPIVLAVVVRKQDVQIRSVIRKSRLHPLVRADGMGRAALRSPRLLRLIQRTEQQDQERHVIRERQPCRRAMPAAQGTAQPAIEGAIAPQLLGRKCLLIGHDKTEHRSRVPDKRRAAFGASDLDLPLALRHTDRDAALGALEKAVRLLLLDALFPRAKSPGKPVAQAQKLLVLLVPRGSSVWKKSGNSRKRAAQAPPPRGRCWRCFRQRTSKRSAAPCSR